METLRDSSKWDNQPNSTHLIDMFLISLYEVKMRVLTETYSLKLSQQGDFSEYPQHNCFQEQVRKIFIYIIFL